jgi:hypothetical protein
MMGDVSTGPEVDPGAEDPVELLQRWVSFGATWQVVASTSREVTVALCRCDGGEEVMRITSGSPQLRSWLAGRTSSEQ